MAATATTDAHAELISSLSQDEIPIKLRCAICSRLAVNAFRLPCCEQAICETCQSTLPSSCPVCEHTPVAAEDCKPNKSLRTTIKVFLRTEEKKREALRSKEVKNSPPPTPLDVIETPVELPTPADAIESKPEPSSTPAQDHVENPSDTTTETPHDAEQDIPQPSIEEISPGQEPSEEIVEKETNGAGNAVFEGDDEQTTENDANEEPASGQSVPQVAGMGTGLGFDSSAAGAFPAMGFGGDFNQMQMMMAMQNGGMAPNAFGNFPMMGMPGMGMDPMAMQNMFLNGGFGAGMNGMNMSMGAGMGGFDGGVGAGFNNEWNGQQSWNVGPDNFNHPNAAGMGTGDYGSNNSGYNPHASRFNQGNYGHGNQYNDYNSYGYQSRGRGRGRGGYGRGGYAQHLPQQFGSGEGFNGPNNEIGTIPTGPKADAALDAASNVDEFGREIRRTSEAKDNASAEPTSKDDSKAVQGHYGTDINQDSTPKDAPDFTDDTPKPIQTLDEVQGFGHNGYNGMYNPGLSRGFPGRGGYNPTIQAVKQADVPINAPTGPKAMRDGLPNTGISGLRVRGNQAPGIPNSRTAESVSAPADPAIDQNGKGGQRSRSPSREKSRDREGERSRSGDRRRSRSRDRRHHRQRHRSGSASEDEKDSERRRERRRERLRRREEGDNSEDAVARAQPVDDEGKDIEGERSRSASPSDSRRSSHRSRRDRDKYRERDKESDREYKSSSHKHRTSNRHRDDRSRSRDRDREHRHRHSRRGSEDIDDKLEKPARSIPPTPIEAEDPSGRPLTATNGAIEIKGASSRRKATLDEIIIPTGPRQDRISAREREKDHDRGKENRDSRRYRDDDDARYRSSRHRDTDREREKERERPKEKDREKDRARAPPTAPAALDPHTLEREARNRERLLKEAQRIAGLNGMSGAKRGREDVDDTRKGRKKGRRGEDGDEARMARLEAERESARWN